MPSKSSKWIAALITLAVIVLSDVTGFLLNSLASHRGVFEYFNDRPWFNIVMATAALALVIFLVTTWLHSRSGDSDDIAAIREDTAAMR
ncbi:MAG: hypothetical protein P4L26_06290, partial [Terracidiphilus sp.]|nr:hypothetical protein [Terracidiphilus sp.]